MLDLRLSPRVGEDLDSIWRYSAARYGVDAADTYLRGFNETFSVLRTHPEAGAAVKGIAGAPVRSFGYRQHRLFYEITDDRIDVLRIAHKAQNHASLFD